MEKYEIKITEPTNGSTHPVIAVTENGEPFGSPVFNKRSVSMSYDVYDAIIACIYKLNKSKSKVESDGHISEDADKSIKEKCAKLKKRNKCLKADNKIYAQTLLEVTTKLNDAEKRIEELESIPRISASRPKYKGSCDPIYKVSEADVDYKLSFEELEKKYGNLEDEYETVKAKNEELDKLLKEANEKLSSEQMVNRELRDKLKDVCSKDICPVPTLESSLDNARTENVRLRNDIDALRKDNIRLTSELNKYQGNDNTKETKPDTDEPKMEKNSVYGEMKNPEYSTTIPEGLDDDAIITPRYGGGYNVRKHDTDKDVLVCVARLFVADEHVSAFNKFYHMTRAFKPCTISDIKVWDTLNPDAQFKVRFEYVHKPESKKAADPKSEKVAVAVHKDGDGDHIGTMAIEGLRHMFKALFCEPDDSEDSEDNNDT